MPPTGTADAFRDGDHRTYAALVHRHTSDLLRIARYCARNPIALGRMEYAEQESAVTYHSDKPTGPTAGSGTAGHTPPGMLVSG